jgi:hypothetical protein
MFVVVSSSGMVLTDTFTDFESAESFRKAVTAISAADPRSMTPSGPERWYTQSVSLMTEKQDYFPWFEAKVFKGEYDNQFYFQEQTVNGSVLKVGDEVSTGTTRADEDYLGNPVILISAGNAEELRALGQAAADELNAK